MAENATTATNVATQPLTFAQKMAQLRAKVATSSWKHEQFVSGTNAGLFVGEKENGKFFILVSCTSLKGGNASTRKAILGIDPIATGLEAEMFQAQLSEADTKSMIESLFGVKAKIIVKQSFSPQWETQEPSQDKNGNLVIKGGSLVYSQTLIAKATEDDELVSENGMPAAIIAEDAV